MTEEQKFGYMDHVSVDQLAIAADIRNVIDENPSGKMISINEIESVSIKIEQLRTQYRNTHIQLQPYMKDEYENLTTTSVRRYYQKSKLTSKNQSIG